MQDRIRLHITPFSPDLLPLIIPSSLRTLATDISFHELATFPERNYGFISLPAMEAHKLRNKVNGSILRGSKVKVEEARQKEDAAEAMAADDAEAEPTTSVKGKSAKKRKRQEGIVPGYTLEEERKVKRGWTQPASVKVKEKRERRAKDKDSRKSAKKQQPASVYTDEAECLFKTVVPPNKKNAKPTDTSKSKAKKQSKTTVIHEFEQTQKHPSFLRSSSKKDQKPVAGYDEEKGWIDEAGQVVEPKRERSSDKQGSSSTSSSSSPASEAVPAVDHERLGSLTLQEQEGEADETSSSGSSESETSSDASDSSDEPSAPLPKPSVSASPAPNISIEDTDKSKSATPAPHPLETLYKKPALPSNDKNKNNLSVDAVPFAFFHSENDGPLTATAKHSIETSTLTSPPSSKIKRDAAARLPNLSIPPQTPFTQRDMMWRSQRSAAPTPDTAMPARGFPSFLGRGRNSRLSTEEIEEEEDDEVIASVEAGAAEDGSAEPTEAVADENVGSSDDDDEEQSDETPIKGKGAAEEGQSAFAKEFYEKRGDFNRSWKKARREAGKAQRAATNRRRKGL